MIPTVEDLESAPLVHRFGDLYNPPALTNFRGSLQAAIDITGIRCLNFPPFGCSDTFPPITWSDSVTGALFLDGHYFLATGASVTQLWRPDRIVRRASHDGIDLESETVLVVGETAALVRLRVTNLGDQRRTMALRFGCKCTITMNRDGWTKPIAPAEYDNEVVPDAERAALLFKARHSAAVCLQGLVPRADGIDERGLSVRRTLAPSETWDTVFLAVVATDATAAAHCYDALARDPDREFDRARDHWNAELAAAFTPGNDRFSGSLPRLETSDEAIGRLYHQGMLGLVYFKREAPDAGLARTYTTLMPRYWPTITWLWDHQLASVAHAMLDPVVTQRLLGGWMSTDLHRCMGTDWLTGAPVGEAYAVNHYAISKIAFDYLRWSGNHAWLRDVVRGSDGVERPVFDRLSVYARSWEEQKTTHGLADYGDLHNLLECVAAYAHEVVGLNLGTVFNLRAIATYLDAMGAPDEAERSRAQAATILRRVQELYVEG